MTCHLCMHLHDLLQQDPRILWKSPKRVGDTDGHDIKHRLQACLPSHTHAQTHTLKVCGPSLIDQNNVAAMAFNPARDLCCCNPSLCHLRSSWSFLFMMCPSPPLFGPAGQPLPMYRNNNWGIFVFRFHVRGLGFSSVRVCSPHVCNAYLSKRWLKCITTFFLDDCEVVFLYLSSLFDLGAEETDQPSRFCVSHWNNSSGKILPI